MDFKKIYKKKKTLFLLVGVILLILFVDFYIGKRQEAVIREKEARKERLEKLAFYSINPDYYDAYAIKGKKEKYEAIIKVENFANEPVYITYPQVDTFVQTGTFWTEVSSKNPEESGEILKLEPQPGLKPRYLFKNIITISRDIDYSAYLMPLYMHVKFRISFLVVPESAFEGQEAGEAVERYAEVYIYFKPYFISDNEILKVLKFTDNKVPEAIPMPPH